MKHEIVDQVPPQPKPLPRIKLDLAADEFLAFAALYACGMGGIHPLRDRVGSGLKAAWVDAFPHHEWSGYVNGLDGYAPDIAASAERLARDAA